MKRDFRKEVVDAGLAWNSFKEILPDWSDSAFESMSGVVELKAFLSRNAGLRFGVDGKLVAKELPAACFKTNKATSAEQVVAAQHDGAATSVTHHAYVHCRMHTCTYAHNNAM